MTANDLGSHCIAAWMIARLSGWDAVEAIVDYVAPFGQVREYVERRDVVQRYSSAPVGFDPTRRGSGATWPFPPKMPAGSSWTA